MSFLIRLGRALARAGHCIFDPTIGTHPALRCIDIRNGGQHRF